MAGPPNWGECTLPAFAVREALASASNTGTYNCDNSKQEVNPWSHCPQLRPNRGWAQASLLPCKPATASSRAARTNGAPTSCSVNGLHCQLGGLARHRLAAAPLPSQSIVQVGNNHNSSTIKACKETENRTQLKQATHAAHKRCHHGRLAGLNGTRDM